MELTGGAILSVTAREGANCQRERERRRGRATELLSWAAACGMREWAERVRRERGGKVFFFFFLFYFVFKTKFNYEPNANSNIVSNILFNANRNEEFW